MEEKFRTDILRELEEFRNSEEWGNRTKSVEMKAREDIQWVAYVDSLKKGAVKMEKRKWTDSHGWLDLLYALRLEDLLSLQTYALLRMKSELQGKLKEKIREELIKSEEDEKNSTKKSKGKQKRKRQRKQKTQVMGSHPYPIEFPTAQDTQHLQPE